MVEYVHLALARDEVSQLLAIHPAMKKHKGRGSADCIKVNCE